MTIHRMTLPVIGRAFGVRVSPREGLPHHMNGGAPRIDVKCTLGQLARTTILLNEWTSSECRAEGVDLHSRFMLISSGTYLQGTAGTRPNATPRSGTLSARVPAAWMPTSPPSP